jgi:hypothetical protein
MKAYNLTYIVNGSVNSARNKVYCVRGDYPIACLATINGMAACKYSHYVSYPSVSVDGKFWIASSTKFDRQATSKEWVLEKDMDRRIWWLDNYKKIHDGLLAHIHD